MTDTPDFTQVQDAEGNFLSINGRVAYSTLAYKSAHLRLGVVKDFRLGYGKRPEVLVAGDHGKSVWKRHDQVACVQHP